MDIKKIRELIDLALKEDLPVGDITTEAIVPPDLLARAVFLAKEDGVLAGIEVAAEVFKKIDPAVEFKIIKQDGQKFKKGEVLAEVSGRAASLLKAERTALNFLQRLTGIATLTRAFVDRVSETKAIILDTRKTTPGWRALEKYAVKMGGGKNHRQNLSEMMLIKDNHIRIAGGISPALKKAKEKASPEIKIEVETTNVNEVKEALEGGADIIMLDNMSLKDIKKAVKMVNGRVPLEVSGKVSLKKVRSLALTGVDFISVGALTHSFKSTDISLEFV
ncbi:MAG: carboxylating nicotinate-nucleotide diphosphorylase [Candidatus Saccharicenans sp.]|nr:MAG: nicotinate-nucleotide diphosphorylase (carboxylating) [Candidatus Aminicenantes bacterium]HEK84930.1 carboxylating nicotinate-nucleotide diphosphorylase [Candidatus Aminicenantes bacterium]